MGQVNVNIRMDEELKRSFDFFCSSIGMNMTTAFCVFARQAVREQRIPFEIAADPFYSQANMRRLEKAVSDVKAGRAKLTAHELLEAENV